jgi:hypothetical protein
VEIYVGRQRKSPWTTAGLVALGDMRRQAFDERVHVRQAAREFVLEVLLGRRPDLAGAAAGRACR